MWPERAAILSATVAPAAEIIFVTNCLLSITLIIRYKVMQKAEAGHLTYVKKSLPAQKGGFHPAEEFRGDANIGSDHPLRQLRDKTRIFCAELFKPGFGRQA